MTFIKPLLKFVADMATVLTGNKPKALSPLSSPNCLTEAKMSRTVNFQFCQLTNDYDMPLAIVRFTAYDDNDNLLAVEQVTYENNLDYFQSEVSAAIDCGIDVCILTPYQLSTFKWLAKVVEA